MTREEKRIAVAQRRNRYWEAELRGNGFIRPEHTMTVTYRWLCALRKVKRSRGSGESMAASAYLNHITDQMLAVAREVSHVDQMTGQQAYDYWQEARKGWTK